MQLELQLRYNASPVRSATAWYTTTYDPLSWLELIAAAGWDQAELRCLIVPRSTSDRTPAGALFIPSNKATGTSSDTQRIRLASELPQLLPYGEAQPRLFLPVNATLNAAVMKSEWAELFDLPNQTYVWSPESGLFALEQQQLLRVSDLLLPPTVQADEWTIATAGTALNQRIRSLGPSEQVTAETILDQGRGDIGTQSTEPDKLPPRPNEPGTSLIDKLKQNITAGFWGTLANLSSAITPAPSGSIPPQLPGRPAGTTAPTPAANPNSTGILQRLQNWLQEKVQQATNSIEEARHREINRLLHLLQTNPDEGLRFAIPFNSDAPRGLSSPGANLTERTVNYGQGGGSGAADYWNIQAEHQRKLIQSYRELANREIALGRHRRAAYIFANLLGDYLEAARTLVDGHYHREAAALYRDKLRDPRRAADCLRAGGLLSEAIPIYRELQEYELIGQLYTELDQPAEAREAYENAVRQQLSQGNYLRAAKLQEDQLDDDEAALHTLDQGWQHSTTQQQSCFLRTFEKLGEAAEHQRATEYLLTALLDSDRRRESKNLPLLTTLATTYPYPPLQHLAKDQTLITVSELLQTRSANQSNWETQQLLGALTKLEPADRLLERDTRRYANVLRKVTPQQPPRLIEKTVNRSTIKWLRTYKLPCTDCQAIAADQQHVYVTGYREQEIVLLRMNHQGQIHYPTQKPWRPEQFEVQRPIRLTWHQPQHLLIHILGQTPVPYDRLFPATDMFPEEVRVGGFAAQADMTVQLASHQGRGLLALQCKNYDEYHVQYYSSLVNQFQKSLAFELPDDLDEHVTPPDHWFIQDLHAHYEYWFVGRASKVYLGQKAIQNSWDLTSQFRRFVAAPHNTLFRLACLLENGCCLLWGYLSNLNQVHLAHDLHEPVGCFTSNGELILAGRNGIEVYTCKQDGVRLIAELKGLQQHPIGVCQLKTDKECLVINQDGSVQVYRWH